MTSRTKPSLRCFNNKGAHVPLSSEAGDESQLLSSNNRNNPSSRNSPSSRRSNSRAKARSNSRAKALSCRKDQQHQAFSCRKETKERAAPKATENITFNERNIKQWLSNQTKTTTPVKPRSPTTTTTTTTRTASEPQKQQPRQRRRMFKLPSERQKEKEDDLVARARFETACQLLHKQILNKEHRLTVSERAFLNRLLDDDDDASSEADRLSQIELSIKTLNHDPLFRSPPASPEKLERGRAMPEMIDRTRSRSSDEDDIEVLSSDSLFSIQQTLQLASNGGRPEEDDLFRYKSKSLGPRHPLSSGGSGTSQLVLSDYDDDLDSPYPILGILPVHRILSLPLMEALRGFLPQQDLNYWLKFDNTSESANMPSLLAKIRASFDTIICIQATDGSVFGSFTRSPWRLQKGWYGACND